MRRSVATSAGGGLSLIVLGLAASWLLTHLAGGADSVVPHLFYVPILFAAVRFGAVAALLVALVSGVLAGPMTMVNVADATTQETARWLTRAGFFVGVGQLMAAMVAPSLPSLRDEVQHRRGEGELARAIEDGQLFLRFQPIVSPHGDDVVGMEALVRWRHPERGELAPGAFLETAERCDLIHDLGRVVLHEACQQAATWARIAQRSGVRPWFVTVNLCGSEVAAPELCERIGRALDASGLDPRLLCLEITEHVLVEDHVGVVERLHDLKALGVRIAVDDFGTGYSSLSYLGSFPVDVVKLDRRFVASLPHEPNAEALAGGLLHLCRGLGFVTVAEGIEQPTQARLMTELGCDLAQGFHYARPMEADEASDLLRAGPGIRLPRARSEV